MTQSELRYRGVIVGLGFIGGADQVSGDALGQRVADLDGTHFQAMQRSERIELVAGSSRDLGRRQRFAERSGARVHGDWREMLAVEKPDIVSVATYTPQHAEVAIAAMEAGARAVYCEKPIAASAEEADRMLAASQRTGALLVVNHNRHFNPNYRQLADFVASGGLGDLTSVSIQWGTGRLGNVGTHLFDAMCLLTRRRVRQVSAALDRAHKPDCRGAEFWDPGGWGMMRLDDGLMVTFDAADHGMVPSRLELNGKLGRATAAGDEIQIQLWGRGNETWPSRRHEATSMDRAMREIVAWLDGARPFSYPADEAAHVLEAIIACHLSDERNAAWTQLPLTGADRQRVVNSG